MAGGLVKTLPRDQAEAKVAAEVAAYREQLAITVVAIDDFKGHRPGSGMAFGIRKGHRVRADHPIAVRYPAQFRPLSDRELERLLADKVRSLRFNAGLAGQTMPEPPTVAAADEL